MDIQVAKMEENSCCRLINFLEKNVTILREETRHSSQFTSDLEIKLESFNEISNGLSDKLKSLWSIAERTCYPINNEIKEFANQISTSWTLTNQQISERYSKMRVASRTFPGVPLSLLLNKIKKEVIVTKLALQTGKIVYCQDHLSKGCTLFNEIADLLRNLERCDNKMQQCLAMSKITPYLSQLEFAVHRFVSKIDMTCESTCTFDFSAFTLLSKLLTGELLYEDCIDPRQVLAECVPKKPVFIFKNNKRKTDKLSG